MYLILRHRLTLLVLAAVLSGTTPAVSATGWMGFRNDTGVTLIIQESVTVSGIIRTFKPQKLFANQTVRDTPPPEGRTRTFTIYDASHPDRPLYTGRFSAPEAGENVLFILKPDGRGGLLVEPLRQHSTASAGPEPKR